MSWMRQVVGKGFLILELDRNEELEVEWSGPIVRSAESYAPPDLVAANRRDLRERVLERFADGCPFLVAKLRSRGEKDEMDYQRRTFFTSLVPSLRRDSTRSSFGGSGDGFGSTGGPGTGRRPL
jgi:hypothetical protein